MFAAPIGDKGVIPLIALDDIGWWVRYIFDNAPSTTGKDFEIASDPVTFPEIVETFKRVTGLPAVYKALSMDEFFELMNGKEVPVASAVPDGKTWDANFRSFFALFRDNIVKRDMDWIRSIHPPTTVEQWMRDMKYTGIPTAIPLKNYEDGSTKLKRLSEKTALL